MKTREELIEEVEELLHQFANLAPGDNDYRYMRYAHNIMEMYDYAVEEENDEKFAQKAQQLIKELKAGLLLL